MNYILGVAGQNAANARRRQDKMDRTMLLTTVATRWAQLDPAKCPFLREVAVRLPGHDDRKQILDGIDLILAGVRTVR